MKMLINMTRNEGTNEYSMKLKLLESIAWNEDEYDTK